MLAKSKFFFFSCSNLVCLHPGKWRCRYGEREGNFGPNISKSCKMFRVRVGSLRVVASIFATRNGIVCAGGGSD